MRAGERSDRCPKLMTPRIGAAACAELLRERKRVDPIGIGLRTYCADDGSVEWQEHREGMSELFASLHVPSEQDAWDDATREQAAALATQLAEEQEVYVAGRARRAADLGREAAAAAGRGDHESALRLAQQAAAIEREFGDAPVWDRVVEIARALRDAARTTDLAS